MKTIMKVVLINGNELNILRNLEYCQENCLAATNLPVHAQHRVLILPDTT